MQCIFKKVFWLNLIHEDSLRNQGVFFYRNNTETFLGYTTRPYEETLHDEVSWLVETGKVQFG